MRARSTVVAAALGISLVGLGGAPALAASGADRDCADFGSQQEAQDALEAVPGDPERLDRDDDGKACESFGYGSQEDDDDADDDVMTVPRGGVDAGAGATAGVEELPLLLTGVGALGLGAAGLVLVRRRPQG